MESAKWRPKTIKFQAPTEEKGMDMRYPEARRVCVYIYIYMQVLSTKTNRS